MLPAKCTLFFFALSCCHPGPLWAGLLQPFDRLYYSGLRAYFQKDWPATEEYLEGALRSRAQLRKVKLACHAQCQAEEREQNKKGTEPANPGISAHEEITATASSGIPPLNISPPKHIQDPGRAGVARTRAPRSHQQGLGLFEGSQRRTWPDHLRELGAFEGVLRRAECHTYCLGQQIGPPSMHRTMRNVEEEFQRREPYNFLQVAYFQLNKLDEAISSAYTFFVANPRHMQMKEDMAKYRKMPEAHNESFRDLEAQPHWEAYEAALTHYNADRYQEAIPYLETSLNESFKALEECRVLCEGPFEEEEGEEDKHQDLYEFIAEHYLQVLKCKQRCVLDIATRPGQRYPIDDFLPSHFDLLHFAYAKVGNWQMAIECAQTFLLFYPYNETVAVGVRQYQTTLGEGHEVTARKNVDSYIRRSLMEKSLIYDAVENLDLVFDDPDPWTPEELIPEVAKERVRLNRTKADDQEDDEPERGSPPYDGPTVTQNARQLNGSHRVVLDGLLTEEECTDLLRLARVSSGPGDGHRGRRSPHTPHENFQGLTLLKSLKMIKEGQVNKSDARLYLEATERSRKMTEWYFPTPETPLHFSFTHLVCRTAIEGQQEARVDLSHPIHADNCILDPESQECWKEPPAYIHRDYSGVLYLNDDFDGGDLFFTAMDAATVTAEVRPKCGRLVAFSSGGENPHGVRAVTRGQRCAIALWFTLSPEYSEQEREEAEKLLKQLDQSPEHSEPEESLSRKHRTLVKSKRDEL